MVEQEVKSFKWNGNYIELYGDEEGSDAIIKIPTWMFDQMVEKIFAVKVRKQ